MSPARRPSQTAVSHLWIAAALVAGTASVVTCLLLERTLLEQLARWTATAPAVVDTLLGWAPVGGLAAYGALLLVWRARRLDRDLDVGRPIDKVAIGLAMVASGPAWALLPHRADGRGRFAELTAIPGPTFARAASWSEDGVLAVLALGALGLGIWLVRTERAGDGDRPSSAAEAASACRWTAIVVGLPHAVVLTALLSALLVEPA